MKMETDNVMPNTGDCFGLREPVEQEIERKKEKAHTLEELSVLKSLVTHFEDRIKFYDSVSSIPNAVKADPKQFLIMHNANELTKKCLVSEKEYLESLLDTHAKGL